LPRAALQKWAYFCGGFKRIAHIPEKEIRYSNYPNGRKPFPMPGFRIMLPAVGFPLRPTTESDVPRVGAEVYQMAFLRELLSKKDPLHALRDVTVNLEFLAEAETRISEFYQTCADAMVREREFWKSLADAELRHADIVREMIGLIAKQPELYKPGISFSTVMIRMFTMEMQRLVEQMHAGRISPDKMCAIALEIEDSTVELNYGKIVRTKNKAFLSLARQIDSDCVEHKSAISRLVK
jgi:rubrerythrin